MQKKTSLAYAFRSCSLWSLVSNASGPLVIENIMMKGYRGTKLPPYVGQGKEKSLRANKIEKES